MTEKTFDYRKIVPVLLTAVGIYATVRYSAECSRGIWNGIMFCTEALVPSLFIFMAISAYAIKSGAAVTLSRPLNRLSEGLFRLPYPALAVMILSVIGGYPVGARCAAMMYERGALTADEARKTVYISVCAGPGFLLNFVGRALMGCAKAGLILLAAEVLSVILTAMIAGRAVKAEGKSPGRDPKAERADNLLIASVTDASASTLRMCAVVIICSAMIEVIAAVCSDKTVADLSSAAIEITTGCGIMCVRYPLALTAFFIGFGGISVHLQIYSALGGLSINKALFFLFRIMQGIICSAVTYILLMVFPIEVGVFNSADVSLTAASSATLAGSAALIMCSLYFIGTMHKLIRR